MTNFNDNAVREAAYYIWKNSGCPANSHTTDWTAAVHQLSAAAPYAVASRKAAVSKISAMDLNAFNAAIIAAKGKKASPLSAASKLMALSMAASTNAALKATTVKSAPAKSTASKATAAKKPAAKKAK